VFFRKSFSFLKKLSERGDDYIFPLREDRHPQANIESSPLSNIFFKIETFLKKFKKSLLLKQVSLIIKNHFYIKRKPF